LARVVRRFLGRRGLLLEAHDAPFLVDLDDSKLASGLLRGNFNGRHGNVRAGVHVLLEHAAVIHFVDVVARENKDVLGALAADGINVLVHGVGGALIPGLRDAHLRGQHFDIVAKAGQRRPARANVAVQA
jgi:hypothetical protein